MERIEGYVIERERGTFLDKGNLWREIPLCDACVHTADTMEEIRGGFSHCRSQNKPRRMYRAMRCEGVTTLLTGTPLSFFFTSSGEHPFNDDFAQLNVEET